MEDQIDRLARDFEQNGFAVIENFLDDSEILAIRKEATRLIKEEASKESVRHIFGNHINAKSDHFITSGDKIRYFFEKNAFELETNKLLVPEEQSLAKIGHALHCQNEPFKAVTASEKVKRVFKAIGYQDPTVIGSMIIFKNPKVGGEYTPHQDATFYYTEPSVRVAGIWIALDDATTENGCLHFIPGSHKFPLARRFVRMTDNETGKIKLDWTAPVKDYDVSKFIEVPVKRGALVLIHGLVVHRSAANNSEAPRWAYTFHVYDQAQCEYAKDNWLQTSDEDTFMRLNDA